MFLIPLHVAILLGDYLQFLKSIFKNWNLYSMSRAWIFYVYVFFFNFWRCFMIAAGPNSIFYVGGHDYIYVYIHNCIYVYIGQHAIFLSVWIVLFTKVVATNYPDSPLAQIPEGRRCSFACGWPRGSSFAQQKIPHIQVEWNATKAHPSAGSYWSL